MSFNKQLKEEIRKEKLLPKNYPGCPRRNQKRPCIDLENIKICYYCGRDLLECEECKQIANTGYGECFKHNP